MAPKFQHSKTARTFIVTGAALAGGTSFELSSGIIDVTMNRIGDTSDITTYGNTDHRFLAGLRNGTFAVTGVFASTYEDKTSPLLGQSTGIWLKHHPFGVGASLPKFTAPVIITQSDIQAVVTDAVKMTMSFQRTGALLSTKGV